MIVKQLAMAAILFIKMKPNFAQAKDLLAMTSYGLFLYSEALGAII